ncbi:MAG: preprotein translocase subunit SecA [Patescibacteria group bacterium]|nr:preprotein translocase subunit SecA [Patescibacteria group bacterium]
MSIFKAFFGDQNANEIKKISPLVDKINNLEDIFSSLSPEDLKNKTLEFKKRIQDGETVEDLLPEAFAAVREAAKRTLGQRHFDVQLMGGVVLARGGIAEMRTGEGKTLVATAPTYLHALTGKGAHVVTVNDYLARRDATWMGQVYNALGMSVGVVNQHESFLYDPAHTEKDQERDDVASYKVVYEFLKPCTRRDAYYADITYGTNNAFGFDYLRDYLAHSDNQLSQRRAKDERHHFAIVDEVDSILIDESRTPLIIAGPVAEAENLYGTFAALVTSYKEEEDYTVDRKFHSIALTERGIEKAEQALGVDNIYTDKGIKYVHHLETAVRAKALYERDKSYVVKDGEVIIVDEFTGRLQPGRRWSEGLHQAVEAKEGVAVKEESRTYGSVTLQNYFRLYQKVSGMTGTAKTSAEEFEKVYGLDVVSIPTNNTPKRIDHPDFIFQTETGKFKAIAKRVRELYDQGQPVLIGTVSIEKNELLSAYLKKEGIPHEILNAKNHEKEGEIIASAGRKKGVVIATNMAGRGVDIKLGGKTATKEEAEEVKNLGGLFVLGTERHEARRIDNQLRGRSGRQGDPGATQFYISLEDSLMKVFASDRVKNMMGRFGIPEDEPIQNIIVSRAIESAQSRIEGMNFDSRKHLLEYDDVVNFQRVTMYSRREDILLGGNAEIMTFLERAAVELGLSEEESRAVTDQFNSQIASLGQAYVSAVREMILQVVDMYWMQHLEAIDYMKGSVRLRAYGQRDPLVEFKREGLRMFKDLEASIFSDVLKLLPNIGAELAPVETPKLHEVHTDITALPGADPLNVGDVAQAPTSEEKVGRNDPCPCGSGKKYKKCHGQ